MFEFAGLVGARKVEDLVYGVFVDVRHFGRMHVLDSWVFVVLRGVQARTQVVM